MPTPATAAAGQAAPTASQEATPPRSQGIRALVPTEPDFLSCVLQPSTPPLPPALTLITPPSGASCTAARPRPPSNTMVPLLCSWIPAMESHFSMSRIEWGDQSGTKSISSIVCCSSTRGAELIFPRIFVIQLNCFDMRLYKVEVKLRKMAGGVSHLFGSKLRLSLSSM